MATRGKNNKNNENYIDIIEELNNFSDKLIPFKALYFENSDCNYFLWLSETIQEPDDDLLEFINLVKKYRYPIYTPKNHH